MPEINPQHIMYNSDEVEHTLDDRHLTDALRQARGTELRLLEEKLTSFFNTTGSPLHVLDIGVGDGHVPTHFSGDMWNRIASYTGIDNSARVLAQCEEAIKKTGLESKVHAIKLDATHLGTSTLATQGFVFDTILCTYFTPGNFRPEEISLDTDENGKIKPYPKEVLHPNKTFQKVFKDAYALLKPGGTLVLGSTYIQSPETRLTQEAFYKNCGMHVITGETDTFTATKEGFWSQRFTEDQVYEYVDWVPRKNIQLIPLDEHNFARMIVVTKP